MFEKSALLMICCDRSSKSLENVPIACKNCAKAIKKNFKSLGYICSNSPKHIGQNDRFFFYAKHNYIK